jgi:Zn-dependent protease
MSTTWLPPVSPPPAEPPPPRQSRLKRALGPVGLVALMVVKFAAKLKVLLLLLPKLKVLTTSASMLVSVGAYALIWGWRFAAGFVALLFVHELGHVIQMKREGVKVSGMLFIPFLGAAGAARSMGGNALAEARIGLAGPILGTLGTAVVFAWAELADSEFLRALAFTGFFLNLFNLLPVVPLDGGRAMAAMAPWMWFLGFAAIIGLIVVAPNPILVLIALLGGLETWRRWKTRRQGLEGNEAYYEVKPLHRLLVGLVYVGLIVICAGGMDVSFVDRSSHF